jgi:tetratricopeptide (TPR) repeat protein
MGRFDEALAHVQRAGVLDPLNAHTQAYIGSVFDIGRRYRAGIEAYDRAVQLDPRNHWFRSDKGGMLLKLGDPEAALQTCLAPRIEHSAPALEENDQWCLALAYDKLGRRAQAEAALTALQAAASNA